MWRTRVNNPYTGWLKNKLPIYGFLATVPFAQKKWNMRYSYLKVCDRDCGKPEQWSLYGQCYKLQEITNYKKYNLQEKNSKFPTETPDISHLKKIRAFKIINGVGRVRVARETMPWITLKEQLCKQPTTTKKKFYWNYKFSRLFFKAFPETMICVRCSNDWFLCSSSLCRYWLFTMLCMRPMSPIFLLHVPFQRQLWFFNAFIIRLFFNVFRLIGLHKLML